MPDSDCLISIDNYYLCSWIRWDGVRACVRVCMCVCVCFVVVVVVCVYVCVRVKGSSSGEV